MALSICARWRPKFPMSFVACLLALNALLSQAAASELSERERSRWLAEVAQAAEEQLALAQELIARHPNDPHPESHFWRGRIATLSQDWPAAAAAYQAVLAQRSDHRAAAEGLIHALAMAEDWPHLRRHIGIWLELPDSSSGWWIAAAHAALEDQDPAIAEDLARRGLARFPDSRELRRLAAQAASDLGDELRAAAHWQALAMDQRASAQDWYGLALISHRLQQAERARTAIRIAHHLAPADGEIARTYLSLLLDHHMPREALILAQRLLADAPSDTQLLLLAARAGEAADDHQQALAWLDAVSENDRDRSWWLLRARIAAQGEDLSTAREAIASLIAAGAVDADLYRWAARLAWQDGDLLAAEAQLRAAIAHPDGQRRSARLQLAQLLLNLGRSDEALALIDELLISEPYNRELSRLRHYASRLLQSP